MARKGPSLPEQVRRLEAENAALRAREQESTESRLGPQDAAGVGGRFAIAQFRDADYVQFDRLLNALPDVAADPKLGYGVAVHLRETHLSAAVDSLGFARSFNRFQVRSRHRIHMALEGGAGDVLLRPGRIGLAARTILARAVEREMLSRSFVRLFERSVETPVVPVAAERRPPE